MSIEGEFLRGAGPVAVLKLLERGEMYGYEIIEALEERTDGVLAMGQSTLYPMLYNLEAKTLIAARWDESGARPRKYYRLTSGGRKRLADDSRTWRRLAAAMDALGLSRVGATRVGALIPHPHFEGALA
ncbi:MAG: PadR family transcriptional regulator [Planctomycetes bacterium]|nr:PadR family transcriptional regulator [Planctomycetota bacterium]